MTEKYLPPVIAPSLSLSLILKRQKTKSTTCLTSSFVGTPKNLKVTAYQVRWCNASLAFCNPPCLHHP